MKKKRKRRTRESRILELKIKFAVFFVVMFSLLFMILWKTSDGFRVFRKEHNQDLVADSGDESTQNELAPDEDSERLELGTNTEGNPRTIIKPKEENIYSFLQGPRAWNSKAPWSGEWCQEYLAGGLFSVFGCGLCDLASIYGTMTPYDCSPIDMYYYAREVSDYSPGGGVGAIDWPYLEKTLSMVGISSEIRDKDDTYEEFCEAINSAAGAIVLVSSYDDNSYWTDTEGHYVNIWSYNKATEEVFLGDSGDPSHNRTWIPLKTVYSALKTSGQHQYLLVYDYKEENDTWKHTGIDANWTIPPYYKSKNPA